MSERFRLVSIALLCPVGHGGSAHDLLQSFALRAGASIVPGFEVADLTEELAVAFETL